jgi:acyl-CoA synthetase (AMP-forming)/AMP-acid ligase II
MRVTRQPWLGAPALSYPDRVPTILDALDRAVARWGDREAVVDLARPDAGRGAPRGATTDGDGATDGDTATAGGPRRVTYAELADLAEGAAVRLVDAGAQPGARVAVAAPNGLALAVAVFACARAGLILAGLNPRMGVGQWARQLAAVRPGVVAATAACRPELEQALAQAGLAPTRVGDAEAVFGATPAQWAFTAKDRPDEAACFQAVFSSGTTGASKAVEVVHRAAMHSAHSYQTLLGLGPHDRTAVVFPLSYISGLCAHLLPMTLAGATSVLLATPDPAAYLATLGREAITWAYAAPAFWQLLLRRSGFDAQATATVRLAAFGGAPMPVSVLDQLRRAVPGAAWHNVYGLSETHSPATMAFDADLLARPNTAGRALPCMEAACVDTDGRDAGAGPGELVLRGSLVTPGYLDDPAATAAALSPEGWLATGDVARIDAEGYVAIVDRVKDVIDRGGHTIYCAELEQVLCDHPGVADAAVVGVPSRFGGEAVACAIEAGPHGAPATGVLRRWVAQRYARVAAPRRVEVVDALPRTASGKVAKPELRAWLGQ